MRRTEGVGQKDARVKGGTLKNVIGEILRNESVCVGGEGHVAKNCIADMPEDVKRKVVDHAHIAIMSPDNKLFAFVSEEAGSNPLCEPAMYGSEKRGKLKRRTEEFAW